MLQQLLLLCSTRSHGEAWASDRGEAGEVTARANGNDGHAARQETCSDNMSRMLLAIALWAGSSHVCPPTSPFQASPLLPQLLGDGVVQRLLLHLALHPLLLLLLLGLRRRGRMQGKVSCEGPPVSPTVLPR